MFYSGKRFFQVILFRILALSKPAIVIAALSAGILAGIWTVPGLADAPGTGIVVEGVSVPGVALGDTRAEIEAVYGAPASCQSVESFGDMASCSFDVEGGGQVSVRYRGPGGSLPSNSPEDEVYVIYWYYQVSGWTTTAGINTTLALQDQDAVFAAYPNATLTYQSMFDWTISDPELGIRVHYHTAYLTGAQTVSMSIIYPYTPQPPEDKYTRVTDIDIAAEKRDFMATVWVQDHLNRNATNAIVQTTWSLPDGSVIGATGYTDSFGRVQFPVKKARSGIYTLRIQNIIYSNYRFNQAESVLSASISK